MPDRYGSVPIFISGRPSVSIVTHFFGMIFVTERGWNAPILKVIRGVAIIRIAIDPLRKANGNTTGTIIGYDFEFK